MSFTISLKFVFFVLNFFDFSLFLEIIIDRLIKNSFNVLFFDVFFKTNVFLYYFFILWVADKCFFLSIVFCYCCCNIYIYTRKFFETISFENCILFFCSIDIVMFFKKCEIKHWTYFIRFFEYFHFFALLSTCALRFNALFVCNWCIYMWYLFRFYYIDSSRVSLHNDRIFWHFCTFFRCDHILSN